ncbi:hypothetical protein CCP4SC76_3410002 [Gammaproteobacteria bacterium]
MAATSGWVGIPVVAVSLGFSGFSVFAGGSTHKKPCFSCGYIFGTHRTRFDLFFGWVGFLSY